MQIRTRVRIVGLGFALIGGSLAHRCFGVVSDETGPSVSVGENSKKEIPIEISGGHEIGKKDFGRPIPLIAAALGVKQEEFRKAFSGVTPAQGRGPTGGEARKNKEALLKVLGPLGVTNERLDEVSDYYRFQPQKKELWKTKSAKGVAVIVDGKLQSIVINEGGSGYSSEPTIKVPGMDREEFKVKLHFDKDLKKNGAIESVEIVTKAPEGAKP